MLERENENIVKTLIERTIQARGSFHLQEALAAHIPRAIKVYLQAEVEHWLERDMLDSQRFARLDDQSLPTIDHITRTFLHSVSPGYSFTREEFLHALDNAVHFAENHLCRPQWTLENFFFDKNEIILLYEFRAKLQYFCEYRYFITLLEQIVQQRGWMEIRVEDIRSLIQRIDDHIVKEHSPRELALLTRPIYDFLLLGDDPFTKSISVKPLLVFFEDKRLITLREYIDKICHIRAHTELTLGELIGIIEDFYPEKHRGETHSAAPDKRQQAKGESLEFETRAGTPSPASDDTKADKRPDDQPLLDGSTVDRGSVTSEGTEKKNIALTLTYAGITHATPTPSLPDLHTMCTVEQHQRFAEKLFGGDHTHFLGVLSTLNGMETWKEASLFLNDYFITNGLDPYNENVIEFTDFIHQRYGTGQQSTV